jgi:hypothetical protein
VAQVADFAGDGQADILWRHAITGSNIVWNNGNSQDKTNIGGVSDPNWRVIDGEAGGTVMGGTGNNTLYGTALNDRLVGGAGNDVLTGGAGADQFVFNSLVGTDTIRDFTASQDRLVFDSAVFVGLTTSNAADRLSINKWGHLLYDADGTAGPGTPLHLATLVGNANIGGQYTIDILVRDAAGKESVQTTTLNVIKVDDIPPVVSANQAFDYAENQSADSVIATVAATDAVGVTDFRFSATSSSTSADGFFSIASDGKVRITASGVAAGVAQNDFEAGANTFSYGIQARDAEGNWSSAVAVTLNVTDVDDTAPVVSPSQSFNDAENQSADTIIAAVAATDAGA